MSRAYVLDPTTKDTLGLVDQSWEKLTYTRRYWGMDTFTMTIQRSRLYASEIVKGRLLYLPDEGDRIFLIEQILSVQEGSRANDLMTVSGRSIEGIGMAERLVIPPAGQDYDKQTAVPGETAMKHYVTDHASESATTAARQIAGLTVVASGGTGANVTVAGRYQYVFDLVKQIGLLTGQGWEITFNPTTEKFEFDVINGVDRHTSVFFDFAFETLERWEELDSIMDSKTVAVVAGQGEGSARDIRTRWSGSEPTGFARREAFLDARDIDLGATAELDARGDAFIAASKGETRLEAGIHQYGSFKYGIHWDMGDLVLIRNEERGIEYTARVVEVSKTFDRSSAAPTVVAIIDRPFPTLKESTAAHGAGAAPGAVDYPAGGVTGGMMLWPAAAAPQGWLLCDGASYLRADYPNLFTALGGASSPWGLPDGTHFNVPDMRGRFPLGKAAAGTGSTLAGTGGALDHTHTGPGHTHGFTATHLHTGPSHTHGFTATHTHTGDAHTHSHAHTSASHSHSHNHDTPHSGEGTGIFWQAANLFTEGQTFTPDQYANTGNPTGTTGADRTDNDATATTPGNTGTDASAASAANTGAASPGTSDAGGTGNTGSASPGTSDSAGTGATGSQNPAFVAVNYIIKT